jgi:hypothetical protein
MKEQMQRMSEHAIGILGYNNHDLTLKLIKNIRQKGCKDRIIFFDNGSNPSFNGLIGDLNTEYIRSEKNLFVNPGWNELFHIAKGRYRFFTLLNNDCYILSNNYFEEVVDYMKANNIVLSSANTINSCRYRPDIIERNRLIDLLSRSTIRESRMGRRQGWLMTLDLENIPVEDLKVPEEIKIWYGDDWIWGKVEDLSLKSCIFTNRYLLHVRASSTSSGAIKKLIEKDNLALERHLQARRYVDANSKNAKYISNSIINKILRRLILRVS